MRLLRALRDELSAVIDRPATAAPDAAATEPLSPGESMLGRWDPWYRTGHQACYGPADTYRIAEEWLGGLHVEDWGCGYAQFREFHRGPYVGIDGTKGWADIVADLRQIAPHATPGLMMRHVLEHNPDWRRILAGAVGCFTKRMVLVVFTPDSGGNDEKVLAHVDAVNVDDLALPHQEIESFFDGCRVLEKRFVPTLTGYTGETVWLVER